MTAPRCRVYLGFGSTWKTARSAITWTEVSNRVMDRRQPISTRRGSTSSHGEADAGDLSLILRNSDRFLDPNHATGPWAAQLKAGVPIKVTGTPLGGVETPVWWGTVKGFPQRFEQGNRLAYVPVQAFDPFDKLGRATFPRSVLEREILESDDPEAYWPLDERSGAEMLDRSGNAHHGTYQNVTLDQDELAVGYGASAEFAQGEGSRGLVSPSPIVTAYPITLEAVLYYEGELVGDSQTVLWHSVDTSITSWMALFVGGSGATNRVLFGLVNGPVIRSVLGTTQISGGIHHVAIVLNNSTNWDVWVDGVEEATTNPVTGSPAWPPAWTFWSVGNTYGSSKGDYGLGGRLNAVTIYDTALSGARIAAHAAAALAPLNGQRVDQRIAWILDELGWPADARDIDTARTTLGPAEFQAGDGALSYLRLLTATEDGRLFITADGKLRLLERYHPWLATEATVPQATFTDTPGFPGVADIQIDPDDDSHIVNVARYTRRGGTQQVARDAASIADFGELEDRIDDLLVRTDSQALGLAQWNVAVNAQPVVRIPTLKVNLNKLNATQQAQILGLEIGDRIRSSRIPQAVGSALTFDAIVEGIRHDITKAEWSVQFVVSPAYNVDVPLFRLGTSQLGGTHILAH